MKGRQYAFVCSLLGIILILYPLVASRYQVFLFIQAMIYAVFCTSYYLLLGPKQARFDNLTYLTIV